MFKLISFFFSLNFFLLNFIYLACIFFINCFFLIVIRIINLLVGIPFLFTFIFSYKYFFSIGFFLFSTTTKILFYFFNRLGVILLDSFSQFIFHFSFFSNFKEKLFRKFYYYRRVYRLSKNLKILLKSVLIVEMNGLILNHSFQLLKPTSVKFLNIVHSYTNVGYRFRVLGRILKFLFNTLSLSYLFQLFIRHFFWRFTFYIMVFLKFLSKKRFIRSKKITNFVLKFVIFIKLFFVWAELPFVLMFRPGTSKKYYQYEDMQPDLRVIGSDKWDFALARDCYFDYDSVLNGYYFFHVFRKLSKFFLNSVLAIFIFLYFFTVNILYTLQLFFFLFFVPFKFFYVYYIFSFSLLLIKVPLSFIYFLFILCIFCFFVFIQVFYKFNFLKFRFFDSNKLITFLIPYLNVNRLIINLLSRISSIFYYLIFKIRNFVYIGFGSVIAAITLNGLVKFSFIDFLKKLNDSKSVGCNSVFYNVSFVFKRLNSYYLKANNFQFLNNFYFFRSSFRLTPDQVQSFKKIGLNGQYPLFYFERLFDLEYSKLELEYESPYYWSFVRQSYVNNEGLLHPKFHVYNLKNFLNFYWNYFSFLNSNSIFSFDSIYAHDFIQLFNSSISRVISCLVNDFFNLLGFKKFNFYTSSSGYLKVSVSKSFSGFYLFHKKYYEKLLYFFWVYFDSPLNKFFFYTIADSSTSSIKTLSFFNYYSEKARHSLSWFLFIFYERLMGKVFINTNKFEDYYEFNFDKSVIKYNKYLSYLELFFGANFSTSFLKSKEEVDVDKLPDSLKSSVRFTEYLEKLAVQKKKNYLDSISDFFTGSFTLFGHFYVFVRDNIFEFIAGWHGIWREYVDSSLTRWYNYKKFNVFAVWFLKSILLIWFCVAFILIFYFLFIIKRLVLILIKKIKNLYV